jgi:uracil-DNA glycosylase family 4
VNQLAASNLNEMIKHCQKCGLWRGAKNAVSGEGPLNSKVMLVGQNPGAEEDKVGRPFVGRAGKFLNKILAANGIKREEVFVSNIVKHLTPQNRVPSSDEVAACVPYLSHQIDLIEPKVVVLMGKVAWQTPRREGVLFVETVHPSAAMRFTKMRKRFEEDFVTLAKSL